MPRVYSTDRIYPQGLMKHKTYDKFTSSPWS